jgi:phospholipase/carboxylesterase
MNRLSPWTSPNHQSFGGLSGFSPVTDTNQGATSARDAANEIRAAEHRNGRSSAPHFVFSPLHYEASYAYPLIIWLHGSQSSERQVLRVMPDLSMRNYVATSPRGTVAINHVFDWADSAGGAEAGLERIQEAVAAAKSQLNVADDRVFLVGYQSGGTMAMRIAMNHPDQFAGVANIGGHFPQGDQPLQNLVAARQRQMLFMYGEESPIYDAADVCADLPLFHSAGLKMMMRQYPGDGELTTQMLRDLNVWIMERVTGQVSESSNVEPGQGSVWN